MPYIELVEATKVLKIGLPANVIITLVKELEGTYKSNIIDIDMDRKILFLSIPSFKGRFVPIPKGVRITVNVFERSSVYEFQTVSLGVIKKDNIYALPVPFPDVVRKTEKRKFVRIPLYLDGRFYLSTEPGAESFAFKSRNVSAGGLLMVTKKHLNVNDIIFIDMKFNDELILKRQKSKIVREDSKVEDGYVFGVQFLDLPQNLEKALVRFIFQQELKLKNVQGATKSK